MHAFLLNLLSLSPVARRRTLASMHNFPKCVIAEQMADMIMYDESIIKYDDMLKIPQALTGWSLRNAGQRWTVAAHVGVLVTDDHPLQQQSVMLCHAPLLQGLDETCIFESIGFGLNLLLELSEDDIGRIDCFVRMSVLAFRFWFG